MTCKFYDNCKEHYKSICINHKHNPQCIIYQLYYQREKQEIEQNLSELNYLWDNLFGG